MWQQDGTCEKNHLIFFLLSLYNKFFLVLWRCSTKGAALRKEPHMVAFAKGSSSSYVAYKHFVTWRIDLIHHMLNKFNIEFKESFFLYCFTEISHSCFCRSFVKVYIVIASLKRYKKTSLVTLFSSINNICLFAKFVLL